MRIVLLLGLLVPMLLAAPVPGPAPKVSAAVDVRRVTAPIGFFAKPEIEQMVGESATTLAPAELKRLLEVLQGDITSNCCQSPVYTLTEARAVECKENKVRATLSRDGKSVIVKPLQGKQLLQLEQPLQEGLTIALRVPAAEAGKGEASLLLVTFRKIVR